MKGNIGDIQWCPTFDDLFLTWGSDLNFYKAENVIPSADSHLTDYNEGPYFPIGEDRVAQFINSSKSFTNIKCVSWCNSVLQDEARLVAVGQANGNISITSYQELCETPANLYARDFSPRTSRGVNSLVWSSMPNTYQLLATLDRGSHESSLLVFDASRPISTLTNSSRLVTSQNVMRGSTELKPHLQFCSNELVHSALFSKNMQSIIVTNSQKQIKIIDCRNGKVNNKIPTKAVYGMLYDPYKETRISSYVDNKVHIWDLRQSTLPIIIVPHEKPIIKMSWCPTRPGLLACLSRDSSTVSLFDLQDTERENMEPNVTLRNAADNSPVFTSSFSWHPTRYNTMITVTAMRKFMEHKIKERITLNWASNGDFIYTGDGLHNENSHANKNQNVESSQSSGEGKNVSSHYSGMMYILNHDKWNDDIKKETLPEPSEKSETDEVDSATNKSGENSSKPPSLISKLIEFDISRIMCLRAIAGYGLSCKEKLLDNNVALKSVNCGDENVLDSLCSVWQWLANAFTLTKSNSYKLKNAKSYNFHGILPILSQPGHRSDILNKSWQDLDIKQPVRIFRSEERTLCLQLLSWLPLDCGVSNSFTTLKLTQNSTLDTAIENALSQNQYTRAAALSVFQLHLPRAIEILQIAAKKDKSDESMLNAVSMAIAGYNGDCKPLWKQTCSKMRASLADPYLRAIFAFLTGDSDSYKPLLLGSELSVCDKLCFALTFLSDNSLVEFLKELVEQLSSASTLDIQGIIVTGFTEKGVNFLQHYVDRTSDIQTAALLALHGFSNLIRTEFTGNKLTIWVENYYQFLSSQKLWHLKAKLVTLAPAISRSSIKPPPAPYPNVTIACYYCMRTVAAPSFTSSALSPPKSQISKMGSSAIKKTAFSCPNCRKPLPQCALCLKHLGTPSQSPSMIERLQGHKAEKQYNEEPPNTPHHLYIGTDTRHRLEEGRAGLNPSSKWFSWCQSCRHGGHAQHLVEWFVEHVECPVSGCRCQCLKLDDIAPQKLQM